jgi:hypothetical protein
MVDRLIHVCVKGPGRRLKGDYGVADAINTASLSVIAGCHSP